MYPNPTTVLISCSVSRVTFLFVVALHTCVCRHLQGSVYVGLADGTLAVLDASDPTSTPRHSIAVGSGAVRSCVCVLGELWVGCEGSIYRLDLQTRSLKVCDEMVVAAAVSAWWGRTLIVLSRPAK